jgi:hypothetical protein
VQPETKEAPSTTALESGHGFEGSSVDPCPWLGKDTRVGTSRPARATDGGARMKARPLAVVGLLGLIVFASGCSKSTTAPAAPAAPTDQQQVNTTLGASATLVDDQLAEDATQVSTAFNGARPALPSRAEAAIQPFAWWQNVTSETITWTLAFSDTDVTGHPQTCIATLNKHMTGQLVVIPRSPTDSTQAGTTRINKPLDRTLTRKVMLKRLLILGIREWRVVEITGAFVSTQPPDNTTKIQSIRIQSASGVDTTITDPLQFFSLSHIIRFGTSDSVAVTVTTTRNDDPVFIHRWDWRHRLRNNLDGTYSFKWVTSAWGGWRHFGIQAMTHGSIYDDTLPYDSQAWHLPFRVQQPDVNYFP